LDADERRLHRVDRAIEGFGSDIPQRRWKLVQKFRIEIAPKFAASTDQIFPKPRLGFVNAERDGFCKGCAEMRCRQALLIKSVTGFMNDSANGLHDVRAIVARGYA